MMTNQSKDNEQEPDRDPMTTPPAASHELSPNDHMTLMLELCKPESMTLVRRWVAALMLVPEDQRESIVQAVESQIVADFTD